MADRVTAKSSDAKFTPHPEGQFVAVCVDVIDLGEKVDSGPNFPDKLSPKCVLVFRTGEKNPDTGEIVDVAQEYTVSMGDKANLRKALESWRGKAYTQEQADEGVPVDKLVGNGALIGVAHKISVAKKRPYAVIQSIVGVPQAMRPTIPMGTDYKRADFWADRKKEYAEAAKKFRADAGAPPAEAEFEEFPGALDDDDDLPF